MKPSYIFLAIVFAVSAAASAQVVPATTGPAALPLSGSLQYDLRYSQTAQLYGDSTLNRQTSVVSGDLAYTSPNPVRPFGLTYSGGDMWNISGPSQQSGVFQHLLVSQGVVGRKWSLNLKDDASYMPQAPTTGFSGIPGVGNLPGVPSVPSQPILTTNTRSVYNTVSSDYAHAINYATSFGVNGSYGILRYPDGNGLEVNSLQAGPQLTLRLNALNSISGQYLYSRSSYPDYTITMETQAALFGFQRAWNRQFKTSVSAGPEWIYGSDSTLIPSSMDLSVNASVSFDTRTTTVTLGYSQAASGGAGLSTQIGVHNKDLNASYERQFGRNFSINATGAFMRTQGLSKTGVTNGKFGGASATRRLGRYFTLFANYTAIQQSSSYALPTNAVSGLSQVIGFGIGYSPLVKHFGK